MNGFPIELFAGVPMEQLLYEMSLEGTYGDEIALRAIENIFNVKVVVISTLGERGRMNILSQHNLPIGLILLGQFAESQGKHYVSPEQVEKFDDESGHDEVYQQVDESSNKYVNIGQRLEIDQSDDDQHETDH